MKPQTNDVLNHLKRFGHISQKDAINSYGCYRLASRIAELRRDGYVIKTDRKTEKNRYGAKVSFAVYTLEATP